MSVEVLLLDGIIAGVGSDGVDGGDVIVSVNIPNAEDTYDDSVEDTVKMLYGETFNFETNDGAAAYFSTGDGESSVTVTLAAVDVGDEIEGTFDALLDGHTLTGAFRATRLDDDYFGNSSPGIPGAISDLAACSAGVESRGEIVGGSFEGGILDDLTCQVWYYVTDTAGDVSIDVTVDLGDVDLYASMEAEFGVTPEASVNVGLTAENIPYTALPEGTSIWIVVAGADPATSDYNLLVTLTTP